MAVAVKDFVRHDRRLDWVSVHDPRSDNYGVAEVLGTVEEKPKLWTPSSLHIDQGREGACVGFGWTNELLASPKPDTTASLVAAERFALASYNEFKRNDEWLGEDYDGTSVLAGAKVTKAHGRIGEYRWARSIEDVRGAVIQEGPVVIGIPWYDLMYDTRPSGLVEVGGNIVGGHCLLIYGYHPSMRIYGEDWNARFRVFRWKNSWGPGYGKNGSGLIRYEDLRDLLAEWGEACVPMQRKMFRLGA